MISIFACGPYILCHTCFIEECKWPWTKYKCKGLTALQEKFIYKNRQWAGFGPWAKCADP